MKVWYTPRVGADLRALNAHISADNPRAAANVVTAIRKAAELVGKDPKRGHATETPGVLRVPVTRYRYAIYFRVLPDGVYIIHIRHSSRRCPKAGEL